MTTRRDLPLVLTCALLAGVVGFAAGAVDVWPAPQLAKVIKRVRPHTPEMNSNYKVLAPFQRGLPPAPITMLGDSLTQWAPWERLLSDPQRIANLGLAGDSSAGVLARVKSGTPIGPTVFLMIGVNDRRAGISAAETSANVEQVVAALQPRRVYVQSILPTDDSDQNVVSRQVNQQSAAMCERTKRCTYLNVAPALAEGDVIKPSMTVDGIHLTWPGYVAWARQIAPLIR